MLLVGFEPTHSYLHKKRAETTGPPRYIPIHTTCISIFSIRFRFQKAIDSITFNRFVNLQIINIRQQHLIIRVISDSTAQLFCYHLPWSETLLCCNPKSWSLFVINTEIYTALKYYKNIQNCLNTIFSLQICIKAKMKCSINFQQSLLTFERNERPSYLKIVCLQYFNRSSLNMWRLTLKCCFRTNWKHFKYLCSKGSMYEQSLRSIRYLVDRWTVTNRWSVEYQWSS